MLVVLLTISAMGGVWGQVGVVLEKPEVPLKAHTLPGSRLNSSHDVYHGNEGQKSDAIRTERIKMLFPGASQAQEITVEIRDGFVFWNGDVMLYPEKEFELKKLEKGNVYTYYSGRWPNGRIPYTISPTHSDYNDILAAIDHINNNTNICMYPRTNESNFVTFVQSTRDQCFSAVGMQGGEQIINVDGCGVGSTIHEICHAAGMWHEQSRNDRDDYITILWENIESGRSNNFETKGESITANGDYDYGSIMHYGDDYFSKNGDPTIVVKIPPGTASTQIGQRSGLSSGDVESLNSMYLSKDCNSGAVTKISLSAPITISPDPVISNQVFTVSTNFVNSGTTTFKGCFYVLIYNASQSSVIATLPAIQEFTGLDPNRGYGSNRIFNGPKLNVTPGTYVAAVFYRENCSSGAYIPVGEEFYSNSVSFQVDPPPTPVLNASVSATSIEHSGGEITYTISSNTTWTVSASVDWISVSPGMGANNGSGKIRVQANSGTVPRNGTITFKGSGVATQTATITQHAAPLELSVSPNELNSPAAESFLTFTVKANTPWAVSEATSWFYCVPSSGTKDALITVTCQANTSTTPRSGVITMNGTGVISQTVVVNQAGLPLSLTVSPSAFNVPATENQQMLQIISNTPWTLSESIAWLSLSSSGGTSDGTVALVFSSNPGVTPRTGTITVSGTGVAPKTITITQAGAAPILGLSTDDLQFVSLESQQFFNLTSNTAWMITESLDWVTVSPALGSGNAKVTVTCQANTGMSNRSGMLTISGDGLLPKIISVTQLGSAAGQDLGAIAGVISTESGVKISGVEIILEGQQTMSVQTDTSGSFNLNPLISGAGYSVRPWLDKNFLNGVSTHDLVVITKHILGVQLLNSPYKIIAADINKSGTVSTSDLIQLRKLVLGIDARYANNTSWRFIDKGFKFPNPENPWETAFPEIVGIASLPGDTTLEFVAVKIGDVTNNATVTSTLRSSALLRLHTPDQSLSAGSLYRLPFYADLNQIEGYQFTLGLDPAKVELVDVEYGVAKAENFGVFEREGMITASWNEAQGARRKAQGETLFTLVVKARTDAASLREVLTINSRITQAEAYRQGGDYLSVSLALTPQRPNALSPMPYALNQNTPNPFSGETVIGFTLPAAGEATLTIQDVTGRTLRVVRGQFAQGYNQVTVKASEVNATGVMTYTLRAGEFTATKKMIALE